MDDVEQVDQEAAASCYDELTGTPGRTNPDEMTGDWLARRFARHRLAAIESLSPQDDGEDFYAARYAERCGDLLKRDAEIARLREALAKARSILVTIVTEGHTDPYFDLTDYPIITQIDAALAPAAEGGERLGAEFEKVWDDNTDKLFEP